VAQPPGADDVSDDAVEHLRSLAGRLGIETRYHDIRGQLQVAGADPLVAAMAAMGVDVDGPGGPEAGVERFLGDLHRDVTNLIVVWGDEPIRGHVVLRTGRRPEGLGFTVRLEGNAGERSTRVALEDLPVVPAPAGMAPLPSEEVRAFELPGPWPVGYHVLAVERDGGSRFSRAEPEMARPGAGNRRPGAQFQAGRAVSGGDVVFADVFVAPRHVAQLGAHERLWGLLVPAYALAGGDGLGAHIGNLVATADAIETVGGKVVATLPLLASFLGVPYDPSPYAPVSRRFWNELYIDLAALPELAEVPAAAENLNGLASFGHAANIRARHFDYRHQYGYVRGVLEQIVGARPDWPAALAEGFSAHLAAHPEVLDYARFRAFGEARGTVWHAWPEAERAGKLGDGDVDPDAVALHAFGQYAVARDLDRLDDHLAARGQHLYLDLPVGASGDGYDTWRDPDVFAWGAGAGAPPDNFFAEGQNWGFPPLRPLLPFAEQVFHFRDVVRHHMAVAGILRLDHAMCLERLFWVPDGTPARDGVYVRYPRDALLAVLTIESVRHGCVVVGEDLGTVPDTIRDAMAGRGMLGMYVAEFSQPSWDGAPLADIGPRQLASIATHDTPTFAGWLHGLDVDRRHVLGQLDDDAAEQARAERRAQVHNLVAFLTHRGDVVRGTVEEDERAVLEGLLRFLGDSDSPAVLVSIDDLLGERNPQNVPGTTVDRPNWVQRVRTSAAELVTDPDVRSLLEVLQDCRLGSHLRSRHRAGEGDR
jgi:4-alpha-glucanotransferase